MSAGPKTTLGALDDDAAPLSLEELERLKALCGEQASHLADLAVPVRELCFVSYERRGLEPATSRKCGEVELRGTDNVHATSGVDEAEPSLEEQERVRGVLDEWSDLEAYLPRVNAPGSRIGSYRYGSHPSPGPPRPRARIHPSKSASIAN